MKNIITISILFFLISCGKESAKKRIIVEEKSSVPPYDTIAIDSFSQGATSVDIAAKIKMSSRKFQDSLRQIKLKNEEERLLKKATDEKLELEKKTAESQKKKEAEINKAKEKSQATIPESTVTP
ncbi:MULTISPECIES: hypothetical protein [unclassified Kaistella]|uniref:hypothetical protein n=1 Tax=unclassified Kaistella TaxID=2762626 RepID=UPI00273762B4|nr:MULTISPECIES: hypothetical protein [unclassified Kaistella]MCZ2084094.1 hypothetical protein [Flavobacteriales bacterium]MDP2452949.1 hypothetical protein [Kaistella sp. SH11-4b]MDP2455858.1 hypothetical protein [Kaistella sp. SH40-3]MDP2458762.1 hypothetical protein [Kaistella sp. SH19-2b]